MAIELALQKIKRRLMNSAANNKKVFEISRLNMRMRFLIWRKKKWIRELKSYPPRKNIEIDSFTHWKQHKILLSFYVVGLPATL